MFSTLFDCGACACLEQVRRCAAQTSARPKRTTWRNECLNRIAKGNNEKPAARSKAAAAKPLGVSLFLSRGSDGFFVGCSFALTLISTQFTARVYSSLFLPFRYNGGRYLLSRCKPYIWLSAPIIILLRHYLSQAF